MRALIEDIYFETKNLSHFGKYHSQYHLVQIKKAEIHVEFQPKSLISGGEIEIRTLDR